jgi:hypothetical protein
MVLRHLRGCAALGGGAEEDIAVVRGFQLGPVGLDRLRVVAGGASSRAMRRDCPTERLRKGLDCQSLREIAGAGFEPATFGL